MENNLRSNKKVTHINDIQENFWCFCSSLRNFICSFDRYVFGPNVSTVKFGYLLPYKNYMIEYILLPLLSGIGITWDNEGGSPVCMSHPGAIADIVFW